MRCSETDDPRETRVPALLIRHKVTNFDDWRQVFSDETATRRANGARGGRIFRNHADPDETWVLLEWDDLERAHLYVRSDDLIEALVRAGVADHPDYWYLEETYRP